MYVMYVCHVCNKCVTINLITVSFTLVQAAGAQNHKATREIIVLQR